MKMASIIGHRGAANIAPENTLAGIHAAHACGLTWVELDVILMGDGSLIMHHDRTLNRSTDGRGELMSLSFDDLWDVDAGAQFRKSHPGVFEGEAIPTLQQALDLVSALDMGINLEIKKHHHSSEALVVPLLEELGAYTKLANDKVLLSSFDHESLSLCHKLRPDFDIGHLFTSLPHNWLELSQDVGAKTVHVSQRLIKKSDVERVRDAGFELYCYTVNNGKKAVELFSWGVNGVFTDDPERIDSAIDKSLS